MSINKKIMMPLLLLFSLLMISAVSAASDTSTDDIVNQDISSNENNNNYKANMDSNHDDVKLVDKANTNTANTKSVDSVNEIKKTRKENNKLSSNKNEGDLLTDTNTPGTFSDLQKNITNSPDDGTINLNKDYHYDTEVSNTGIIIENKKITINGNGHTLDAKGQSRIFTLKNAILILNNLKIINGKIEIEYTGANDDGCGGAISIDKYSTLNITNSQFNNNQALGGGAIYTSGTLTVINTTFNQNQATDSGGAINTVDNNAKVMNSLFNKNTAPDGWGDGIFNNAGNCVVEDSVFIDDTIDSNNDFGGSTTTTDTKFIDDENSFTALNAWINIGNLPDSITLEYDYTRQDGESNIIINRTITIDGNGKTINANQKGRIFNIANTGDLTLINCTLTGGQYYDLSGNYGGGAIISYGDLTITNSNLTQNTADLGGAIYNNGDLTITNSNLTQNTAKYNGGAIINVDGTVTITNSNLTQNNAEQFGGAIISYGDLTIINSKLTDNTAEQFGGAIYNSHRSLLTLMSSNLQYEGIYIYSYNEQDVVPIGGDISFLTTQSFIMSIPDVIVGNNVTVNLTSIDGGSYTNPVLVNITGPINTNLTINVVNGEGIGNISLPIGKYSAKISIINGTTVTTITQNFKVMTETSFSALYTNITKLTTDTLTLTHNYTYDDRTDKDLITGIPINKTITINGNGYTIDGNNTARIFKITNANVTITNITLTKGKGQNDDPNGLNVGGAIYTTDNCNVTITDSKLTHNTAERYGGAILTEKSYINITHTNINNNNANHGSGGAIYTHNSHINITHTNINNNNVNHGSGGAILTEKSYINITHTNINNNTANSAGGAIYTENSHINITHTNITHNNAAYSGAIYTENSHINITHTNINNNTANSGGAIYAIRNPHINITHTNINNNNATNGIGGAIYTEESAINISYTSFIKNTVKEADKYDGGGAICAGVDSIMVVSSSLFMDNTASNKGGAIYGRNFKNLSVNNNILLNNTKTNVIYLYKYYYSADFKYNLDCNWFGNNETNHMNKPDTVQLKDGFSPNNVLVFDDWLFLTATGDLDSVTVFSEKNITFKLSRYDNNTGEILDYDNGLLYPVNLTVSYEKGTGNESVRLGGNVTFKADTVGIGSVTANISNVRYSIGLNIVKEELDTLIKDIKFDSLFKDKPVTINGTLTDKDNNALAYQKISINITSNNGYNIYNYGYTDGKGKFSITLTPTISGKVNIIATYDGNDTNDNINYHPTKITKTDVNVEEVQYNITFDPLETSYDYNTTATITGTVTTNYQTLDVTSVNITLNNGDKTSVKLNDGKFTYTFNGTIGGLNNITVTCKDATNTTQAFIKYPTQFTITVSNSTTDEPIHILVEEDNGFSGIVNLTMNNILVGTVTLHDGRGSNNTIIIPESGLHQLKITYPGNIEYNATNATSNNFLILNKTSFAYLQQQIQNTTKNNVNNLTLTNDYKYDPNTDQELKHGITINNEFTIYGNGYTIDGDGQARIFFVTGDSDLTIENLTLCNGRGQNVTDPIGNVWNLGGAIYADDNTIVSINNCNLAQNIAEDEIGEGGAIYTRYNTTININNTTFNNNNATTYGGAILINTNSTLNINNTTFNNNSALYGGAIYNENNDLTITNSILQNNKAQKGSGIYINNGTLTTINTKFINNNVDGENYHIKHKDSQLTIETITDITEGTILTIKISADKSFNNNVTLNINGNNYTVKIINGQGQISIPNLKPGTYTAKLIFKGNDNYTEINVTSNSFKVNSKPVDPTPTPVGKQNTKIVAKNKVYKPAKYNTYEVTVKNSKGKLIKNTKVKLRIGKKTYTSKTNNKGVATFKIPNKKSKKKSTKKTYKITATLNKNAKNDKLTLKIGSKKYNTKTNNKGKGTFKIKTTKKIRKYTITLKTTNGQAVQKQKVTLKVNKKTFKATTNSKGKATFKINNLNKKGKYKAKITYKGNNNYNKTSKNVKITIKE